MCDKLCQTCPWQYCLGEDRQKCRSGTKKFPALILFLLGFLAGNLIPNIIWKAKWQQKTWASVYFLSTFAGKNTGNIEYLKEILKYRGVFYLLNIICGFSVFGAPLTSWMLSKVVHNKGGLYNRLTEQIHLRTFCLRECEAYVKAAGLALNRNQILQYYMIFGGVPYYWGFLKKGLSLSQNIDSILFEKDAPLRDEFKYLYASVFKKPENYVKIIEALGTKKVGMTREEIITATKIPNSGDLTTKLEELESCGFIRKYNAFGMKKKNAIYQLMDCFTLFYFKFLKSEQTDEHFWTNQINTPAVNTWLGLAFERVCMEHVDQIKFKLGISGVLTEVNSWYCKSDPDNGIFGSQIDMLIARKDQVINLCEMKYSQSEYTITEKVDRSIRNKISDLRVVYGTKYAIYPTLITTYGVVENSYSQELQSVVTMDDLFA